MEAASAPLSRFPLTATAHLYFCMSSTSAFVGSIPANYDRFMGPAMFAPYAADLAARVVAPPGGRVLELACGTGIVTRRLRSTLAESVRLVATDLNEPMLAYAREAAGAASNLEWRQADMTALPFPDGSFNAVVCQFGLMFVPEKSQALREAHRVLGPGGQLLINVWDTMEANPFTLVTHETVASLYDQDPPLFFAVPFSMGNRPALEQLVAGAGFATVTGYTVSLESVSPSARSLATGLVEGSPLSIQIRERGTPTVDAVVDKVTEALGRLGGMAPFRFTLQAHVIDARVAG